MTPSGKQRRSRVVAWAAALSGSLAFTPGVSADPTPDLSAASTAEFLGFYEAQRRGGYPAVPASELQALAAERVAGAAGGAEKVSSGKGSGKGVSTL